VSGRSGSAASGRPRPQGDEAELFEAFNGYLVRTVQRNTNTRHLSFTLADEASDERFERGAGR
jgi:hypothetical protein